jgi:hypothetical protein
VWLHYKLSLIFVYAIDGTEVHTWSQGQIQKYPSCMGYGSNFSFVHSLKCNHNMKYGIYMYIIEWWVLCSSMQSFTCCQSLTAGILLLWPYPRNNSFTTKLMCVYILSLREWILQSFDSSHMHLCFIHSWCTTEDMKIYYYYYYYYYTYTCTSSFFKYGVVNVVLSTLQWK